MKNLLASARTLARDDRGLTTVEYVLLLCLIVGVAVATWDRLGTTLHDELVNTEDEINTAFD